MEDGMIGLGGCILSTLTIRDEVTAWASLICQVAIAAVTCGIQIWRMIRDRNADKENNKKEDGKK